MKAMFVSPTNGAAVRTQAEEKDQFSFLSIDKIKVVRCMMRILGFFFRLSGNKPRKLKDISGF